MQITRTRTGRARTTWIDRAGQSCAIEDASTRTEPCLWLGVERAGDLPSRMLLSQDQAAALLPLLASFVASGTIAHQDAPQPV